MKYIIIASAGISLFYVSYLLLLRKKDDFKLLRIYLMGSVILSLLIPLANFKINTGISFLENEPEQVIIHYTGSENALVNDNMTVPTSLWINFTDWFSQLSALNWGTLIINLYLIVCLFLLLRIVLQIILLTNQYLKSTKIKHDDCILLYNDRFSNTFSFFKWIFIQRNQETDDLNQMITHEKIHVSQFHSLDLLVMELLTAVMWFNPLIWMMKNSVQLVHEYLADEGALNSGIDPLRYRVLLLNQVTEEKLICLSSSFSSARSPGKYSLIKKRIIMITNKKISSKTKSGLLALIPVSAFLLILTGSVNGTLARDAKDVNLIGKTAIQNISEDPANNPVDFGETLTDTVWSNRSAKVIVRDNPDDTVKTSHHDWDDVEVIGYGNQKSDTINLVSKGKIEENNKLSVRRADDKTSKERLLNDENGNRDNTAEDLIGEVKIKGKSSNVLYLVDGKEVTDVSGINPDNIQSIEVKKNENIRKYKDYDGVVIVTMKKEGVKE